MRRVSSAEFIRNFSALSDAALNEPLLISRHERDRLVVLGIDLYRDLMASISSDGLDQLTIKGIEHGLNR
jgi:hypothetical protein